jgi:hypothetical protein
MKKIFDSFDSNVDFAYYAEQHYLPLLERLSDLNNPYGLDEKDRRLLAFLCEDLGDLCNKFQNEEGY